MTRKTLSFKVDAKKLIPFMAAIMNIPESDVMVAMELRKDLFSTRDTINMNDPRQVEKEISKLGSNRRVRMAIKTLKDLNLIVEKTDPNTGEHVMVRNLSSNDSIRILERLSMNMMTAVKYYIKNPTNWPNFPLITPNYQSKKWSAIKSRQKKQTR